MIQHREVWRNAPGPFDKPRVVIMPLSRTQLEATIEVIDLAIRPIRTLQGEEAMWAAIHKMRAEAIDAAAEKDRKWVAERIDQVLAAHNLRPPVVH